MADSFMIRFPSLGKPCYANVYVFDTVPKQYHVHLVNPHLCVNIPSSMIFIETGKELSLLEKQKIPGDILRSIQEEITRGLK